MTNQIDNSNATVSATISSFDQVQMKKFNHTEIKGTDVISAIQNNKELCIIVKYPCNSPVCMAFNRGINDNSWNKNGIYNEFNLPKTAALADSYSTLQVSNLADNNNYINPSANFESTLLKNKNGVIIGITFLHLK